MLKMRVGKRELLLGGVLASTFFVMLVLNLLTPLNVDDYTYMYSFVTGERIRSISDIFEGVVYHYYNFNGRTFAHIIAPLFLMLQPWVFDILNSFMFLIVGGLIYKFTLGEDKGKVKYLAIIYVAMFLVIPDFGQTALWLTGSCNYLWNIAVMLLFLLPYYEMIIRKKTMSKFLIGPFLLCAIFSGGANENTSAATLLCALIMMIYMACLKIKIPKWMFIGEVLGIASFAVMILAPGYQVRVDQISQSHSTIVNYVNRFAEATSKLQEQIGMLIWVIIVMFILGYFYKIKKQQMVLASIFFFTALAANYAMIMTPYYPERAFTGPAIFMLIAGMILFYNLAIKWIEIAKKIVIAYMVVNFFFVFIAAFDHIFVMYYWFIVREGMIEEQKAAGVKDVEVFKITTSNSYSVFYIGDYSKTADEWPNPEIAKYYGIDSIVYNEVWSK